MEKPNPNKNIPSFTSVCGVHRICSKSKMLYTRPKPDVLQSILQSKANADYKSRRLWYELNMPECTSHLFDGQMLSDMPESLTCAKSRSRRKQSEKSEDGEFKSKATSNYMVMRQEREHFRTKLVELILHMDDDQEGIEKQDSFPDQSEREVLRYYYYIKHGIDTIHVSTISKKTLKRQVSPFPNLPIINILNSCFAESTIWCRFS